LYLPVRHIPDGFLGPAIEVQRKTVKAVVVAGNIVLQPLLDDLVDAQIPLTHGRLAGIVKIPRSEFLSTQRSYRNPEAWGKNPLRGPSGTDPYQITARDFPAHFGFSRKKGIGF
jgi:hypothetical protein